MIKSFIKCIGKYKKEAILTPIFVSFEVILEVIIPIFTGVLVNIVDFNAEKIEELDIFTKFFYTKFGTDQVGLTNVIIFVGIAIVIMSLLSLLCGYLAGKFCAIASAGFAKNIRDKEFRNIQNFSFANIDKFSNASLLTRLSSDVFHVRMTFQHIIRTAIRSPLMLITALFVTFKINTTIGFVFLALIPILAFGLFFIANKVHPLFEKVFYDYDDLNDVVQENIRGIRVVKSFVKGEDEKKKFNSVSDRIFTGFIKAEKLIALISPLMQFTIYTSLIFISYIGAGLVWSNNSSITVGNLATIITYASMILNSLLMFHFVYVNIIISQPSMERIYEVFKEEPTITNPENPIYNVANGDIEFKKVNFSYSNNIEKLALKNATLTIKSGQTIGILGGTGSGKSSLVQLIPRLYDATQGEVYVGGKNVKEYDIKTLRDNVSMVLQKNVLFSGTIIENMRWGKEDATLEEIEKVCKISQADEFIKQFPDGYETHIEQGGSNVSGGQKQRLCIARALLKNPKILILDDSTSAVDTKTDALIRAEFKNYIPEITKIIISQRVASIQDADQIIIMDNGNIDQIGTHEELLKTNKIYQEIYNQQTGGGR